VIEGVILIVVGLLAIVAWAAAWRTMNWLGDAEDIIEHAAGVGEVTGPIYDYKRRTPRRSM
jgi:hypothetical protein